MCKNNIYLDKGIFTDEIREDMKSMHKKRVLVAGGGLGGIRAALTCYTYGHEVVLCEKSRRLGGLLSYAENLSFKSRMIYYLRQLEKKVLASSIELKLVTEVTPEYINNHNVDVLIGAIGLNAIKPEINGINYQQVMSAEEAFQSISKVGNSVVIIGGGPAGIELGLQLSSLGKFVTVFEVKDRIRGNNLALNDYSLGGKRGLRIYCNSIVRRIDEDGVSVSLIQGEKYFHTDTVIYAVGQKVKSEEMNKLQGCVKEFYPLGKTGKRDIFMVNCEAFLTARNIGWY